MYIISIPLKGLGYLFPNKEDIWIFGNTYGYKDNSKYFYEYICENKKNRIRAIWISKNREVKTIGESYYYLSLKGLYYQYISSVVVLTTGMNDVAAFTLTNKYIVQLWHGIPVKKLLLDSPETSPIPKRFLLLNKIFYFLLKKKLSNYDLICSVNKNNQDCLSHAFGVDLYKVPITGTPRQQIIKDNASLLKKERRILFAPTWQDSNKKAIKWIEYVLTNKMMHFLSVNDIHLDLLIHPLNSSLFNDIKITGVNIITPEDINMELGRYELLITDFSSIAFDFSLLKRPVLFSCLDIDGYVNDRGIYSSYLDFLNDSKLKNNELIDKIDLYLNKKEALDIITIDNLNTNPMENIIREIYKKNEKNIICN